jgi:NAD(P)H-hydrate epimerase
MKVVNSKEMFDLEKQALASGISEKKMMKNAAKSIVKHLENSLEINLNAGISILVGKGNNGGDAIILGALLSRKYKVKIFEILKRSEDIAITLKREKPKDTNIELYEFNTNMINTIKLNIQKDNLIMDGILGIGIKRKLDQNLSKITNHINSLNSYICAVDIPTGINSDDGTIDKNSIKATETLMLGYPKKGILNSSNFNFIGRISTLDIGIDNNISGRINLLNSDYIKKIEFSQKENNHKYMNGKLVILAGSRNYIGANLLCNYSALRSGVGLIANILSKDLYPFLAGKINDVIYFDQDFQNDQSIQHSLEIINSYDAVLLGPGVGSEEKQLDYYSKILTGGIKIPLILDADGIKLLNTANRKYFPDKIIITPHIGEMSFFSGISKETIIKDRLKCAIEISEKFDIYTVLKGPCTIVSTPSGNANFAPWVNSGLAKAGSGDILAGLIAGFVANKNLKNLLHSIELGVFIHGFSGELTRKQKGKISMNATDILYNIPEAIKSFF